MMTKSLARKTKNKGEESTLIRHLLMLLNYLGYFWRNNTGAHEIKSSGSRRYIRYGHPGSGDILGVVKGRAVAIEGKSKRGVQSDAQKEFQRNFEKHGGIYILARQQDDALIPVRRIYEGSVRCEHCGSFRSL
jgi:hypothetical protein